MLMIRPRRSFIMRRNTAFDSRYTAVRLVVMTWFQSSGFMRSNSPSRVMAALLTRMVGMLWVASSCASSASIDASLDTSSTAPRPLRPWAAKVAVSSAAPASLVEVPMTRAPAAAMPTAMARPIPRDPPVTSTTSLSNMFRTPRDQSSATGRGQRGLKCRTILEGETCQIRAPVDAAIQTTEDFARAALDDLGRAGRNQRTDRILPAHRAYQLCDQQLTNVIRLRMRARIHGAHVSNGGLDESHTGQTHRQTLCGRRHEAAM